MTSQNFSSISLFEVPHEALLVKLFLSSICFMYSLQLLALDHSIWELVFMAALAEGTLFCKHIIHFFAELRRPLININIGFISGSEGMFM